MGLFGDSDDSLDEAKRMLDANRGLYSQIELPKYQEYVPTLYDNESATAALTSDDPVMKSKQLEALAQMEDLSSTGLTDQDRAGFAQARALGDQEAKAGTESALQGAAARGVSGSGQEFALREAANQAGAQRAQQAALAQQAQAAQNRQAYLQAYAGQLNQTRQQDYNTSAANTNIINQFNQANTTARNQTNAANVSSKNQAFQYNQGLQDKTYQNQLTQADRMAGLNNQQGQLSAAEEEAKQKRNQAIGGLVGGVAGGVFGGPAGAAVGSQAGSAIA